MGTTSIDVAHVLHGDILTTPIFRQPFHDGPMRLSIFLLIALSITTSAVAQDKADSPNVTIRGLSVGMTAEQVISVLNKIPDCAHVATTGCLVWTFSSCPHEPVTVDRLGEMKCAYLTEDRAHPESLEINLTSKLTPNIVRRIYLHVRSGSSLSQVTRVAAEKYGSPTGILLNKTAGRMFDGALRKLALQTASSFGLVPIETDALPIIQVLWRISDKVLMVLSPDSNDTYSLTMLLEGTEVLEQQAADAEKKRINPRPRF